MITITKKVHFSRGTRGERKLAESERPSKAAPAGRVPRVARLMALAIRLDALLRAGTVTDISELARLAHVTQPRMTQIMNLNLLATDIQERILFFPPTTSGRDPINERRLRPIAARVSWKEQRVLWQNLLARRIPTLAGE
jgi:hypothetical protein